MTHTDLPTLPPVRGDSAVPDEPVTAESQPPPSRRRRPPGPPRAPRDGERPRRMWGAGHGLVVTVLALVFAALLTAPGAHKRAYNQPEGWQREVALAVTGPLDWVSHALFLDRPRAALQALAGRSGTDDIDTEIVAGTDQTAAPRPTPAEPAVTTPAATPRQPAKKAFSPERPLRIWIAGDSLMVTPGYAIVRAAGASAAVTTVGQVEGRVATGLTRPDVFNWFAEVRDKVASLKPNVVVLGFGGNDDKAYMTGLPEGVSIGEFGDASWKKEYSRRLRALFGAIERAGAHTVWVGLPLTQSPEQSRRFDIVNATVAAEAERHPGSVTYVDTYLLFAGDDGGYAEYITGPTGKVVRAREGDGVHFAREGGDIIAREVLKALNQKYDLTSWKKR